MTNEDIASGLGSVTQFLPLVILAGLYYLLVYRRHSRPTGVSLTLRWRLLSTLVLFAAGAAASATSILVVLSGRQATGLEGAIDVFGEHLDTYAIALARSGLLWTVVGPLVMWGAPMLRAPGWLVLIVLLTILLEPASTGLSIAMLNISSGFQPDAAYLRSWQTWFGYLATFPSNILAFTKSGALIMVANWLHRLQPTDASLKQANWDDSVLLDGEAGGATRLLCGHAWLANAAFHSKVLGRYQDKWEAVAPELGLDIHLLASVCVSARRHNQRHGLLLTAVMLTGLMLAGVIGAMGVIAAVLAAGVLQFRHKCYQRRQARLFSRDAFDPAVANRFRAELFPGIAAALPSDEQNLVIYSGFMPFVGAGLDLGGWSFVTFVDKPKIEDRPETITSFTVSELYADIDAAVENLRLPGLRRQDFYFIRGTDLRDTKIVTDLAARPPQILVAEQVARLAATDSRLRHYKCSQIILWGGEVVISQFLRCTLLGSSLFVEMKRFLLPPLATQYHNVDTLAPDRASTWIGLLLVSLIVSPVSAVFGPAFALEMLMDRIGRSRVIQRGRTARRHKEIVRNKLHDYGASASLRASLAQNAFMHFFQKSDADFAGKVIERKLLDQLVQFLDARGIDSTEIKDRQRTILNNGILVQGGDVRAESLAVGQGAQAIKVESRKTDHSAAAGG